MNRNAVFGIVIALSIATFAATIVGSFGALKAEAAKSDKWCFNIQEGEACFQDKKTCLLAWQTDPNRESECHRVKL